MAGATSPWTRSRPSRPSPADTFGIFVWATFRNTGHQDLLLLTTNSIEFQPGNGDGTFEPKSTNLANPVPDNQDISVMTTADFNGDGKLDFAIATGSDSHTLTPYLGNGDGTFRTGTALQFADRNEVTALSFSVRLQSRRQARPVIVFTTQNGYWTPNMAVLGVSWQRKRAPFNPRSSCTTPFSQWPWAI